MTDDERTQYQAQVEWERRMAQPKTDDELTELRRLLKSATEDADRQRTTIREMMQERDALRAELRLRDGNGLISGLVAHLSDRIDVLCKERDALRRVNHRGLCGCEEQVGVYGCGVDCPCRCHALVIEAQRRGAERMQERAVYVCASLGALSALDAIKRLDVDE